ncbi:Clp protease ClpP [Ensifer sp. NBAIM29]|nr:Clp protease ClpP [Ensifer sp. NBAIM29]
MDVLKNGSLYLYGTVGAGVADGEPGFRDVDVRDALAQIGDKDVTVRINSSGGWVSDGLAIHSMLNSHRGRVTVIVDGVAASIASVIAMAGEEIIMAHGSFMMVHDSACVTAGDTKDHRKAIEALETVNQSIASIYAKQTRRPNAEIRKEMAEETWMDANESVRKRYATRAQVGRSSQPRALLVHAYKKVPQQIAAMAGTATLSAGFKAAMARAERAKDEDAIEDFVRKLYPRRRNEPGFQQALASLRESYPEAIERALSRPANVVDGPWRDVVDEVNQRNGFFALHPAVGK